MTMTAMMVMTVMMLMPAVMLMAIVLMIKLVMTILTMILMVMAIFRAKGKYEIFTDMDKNIRQGTYATPTMPLFSGTFAQ